MQHFLCELFDIPDPSYLENIHDLFDIEEKQLIYASLYDHSHIHFNLLFTHAWYQCFGIYPDKISCFKAWQHKKSHQNKTNKVNKENNQNNEKRKEEIETDVLLIYKYIHEQTFQKYISNITSPRVQMFQQNTKQFAQLILYRNEEDEENEYKNKKEEEKKEKEKSRYKFIEEKLKEKLFHRLCPYIMFYHSHSQKNKNDKDKDKKLEKENIDKISKKDLTLYQFYTSLIQCINEQKNAQEQEPFYKEAIQMIEKYNLKICNVYTKFHLYPISHIIYDQKNWIALNPLECISHQLIQDYYFCRMLLLKPCICHFKKNANNIEGKEEHVINEENENIHELIDILHHALQNKLEQEETYSFGNFHMFLFSHDEKSEKRKEEIENLFLKSPYVFQACVPRILGPTFWIDPKIDILCEKSFPTNNVFNQTIIFTNTSLHSDFLLKQKDFQSKTNSLFSKFQIIFIPYDEKKAKSILKTQLNTVPYIPKEKEIQKDYFKSYIANLSAKTARDVHFAKTLIHFKHHLYRYMYHKNISLEKSKQTFQEVKKINQDKNKKDGEESNTPYCIFYVDTRPNISGILSIIITLSNLKKVEDWDIVILTPSKNYAYYIEYLGENIKFIHHPLIDLPKLNIDGYNRIMKSEKTWKNLEALGYQKALILQDDSMLLRPGLEERFLDFYDYVGPPWLRCISNKQLMDYMGVRLVGNGGLSLRNIRKMVYICETFREEKNYLFNDMLQPVQEDVYFAMCAKLLDEKIAKNEESEESRIIIPDYNEASYFGVEQVFNKNTLGIHKFWVYNTSENVDTYFKYLFE